MEKMSMGIMLYVMICTETEIFSQQDTLYFCLLVGRKKGQENGHNNILKHAIPFSVHRDL
jgi:hypothetical protein